MNRLYFYICFIALLTMACAKEDSLTPSGIEENYLAIPEDATDPVSVLRREFQERTGIHLLFNDTIRHEQQGTYNDGTPIWYTETIDFNFHIVNSDDYGYRFGYITDYNEMVSASEAVETYILPNFGEKVRPYSLFLVNSCSWEGYNSGERKNGIWEEDYLNGLRCLCLSMGDFIDLSDEEKATYCTNLIQGMVSDRLTNLANDDTTLDAFYAFCEEYYYYYFDEVKLPSGMDPDNMTAEDMYTLGFLEDDFWLWFPGDEEDLVDYIDAIFNMDEEEFKATYADYSIIIEKYDILKNIIVEMGYNI